MSIGTHFDQQYPIGGHMGFAGRVERGACGENCNCDRHFRPEMYARYVPTIDPSTGRRVGSLAAYIFDGSRAT